jgi:hypothetical protein
MHYPYIALAFAETRDSLSKHIYRLGGRIDSSQNRAADAGRKTKSEVTAVLSSRYRY